MRGARVRSLVASSLVLATCLLTAACSSGSDSGASEQEKIDSACALIARLADSAGPLADSDVADPDSFRQQLDAAVLEYMTTLDSLAEVVPSSLRSDVAAVRRDVEHHEFDDAIAARVPIDDWATRNCK